MKKLTNVIAIMTALILATSINGFAFGTSKFEKEVEVEKSGIKLTREVVKGGYDIMSTQELAELMKSGKDIVIVDTMPYEASYKKAHIPGAKQFLFPIPEMVEWDNAETDGKSQEDFVALLGSDKDKTIIFYCGFVKCTRSHNAALWAKKLGYKNIYRQPGGIFAWKGAGLDVGTVK